MRGLVSSCIVLLAVLAALCAAHDLLIDGKLVCGPNGYPDKARVMIQNDWQKWVDVDFNYNGNGNTWPPNVAALPKMRLGEPPCTGGNPCSSWNTALKPIDFVSNYTYSFDWPLTPTPGYAACKTKQTNCGNPVLALAPVAGVHWSDNWPSNPLWKPNLFNGRGSPKFSSSGVWTITESDFGSIQCNYVCTGNRTQCAVGACADRCNSFEFLQVKTTSGSTFISVKVTNYCPDPFYYAQFALDDGMQLSSPAIGSTYNGVKYNGWQVKSVTPSGSSTAWLQFNAPSPIAAFAKGAWEIFNFTVTNYSPVHLWTVLGHEGASWDYFPAVDVSSCPCTDCDTTTTNGCPPGFSGPDCKQCDKTPPPGGFTWFCLDSKNPDDPFQLVKIPTSKVGSSPYVAPGFVPSATDNLQVDSQGYLISCDCKRIKFDCSNVSFCSGHGTCIQQNDTCDCDPTYIGPDCQSPTTTPALTTTTPVGTTPTPTTTVPGQTTPTPTTTVPPTTPPQSNPPCYNGGKFCTGHGTCVSSDQCKCADGFQGADCSVVIVVDDKHYCNEFINCTDCTTLGSSVGLNCTWCRDIIGGGCVSADSCSVSGNAECTGGGVQFVAEPCPDSCSNHGVCVNVSCSVYTDKHQSPPKINGQLACINDGSGSFVDPVTNATVVIAPSNASFCVCKKGYKGANCGGKASNLGKALAISGGVIAAIVICGVIILVLCAFGAKKGVDFVLLNQQAGADFKINPTHEHRDHEHMSALHS